MRIDMKITLTKGKDYSHAYAGISEATLTVTTEQAKTLKNLINKHLRGASRDKEATDA